MTSKEALDRLPELMLAKDITVLNEISDCFNTIYKDLDASEILKKKEVAIDELKNCIKHDSEDRPALEEYNAFAGDENSLTKDEFNLLKEWLNDTEATKDMR